jgi:outer membrane protein TolC
MSYLSEGLRKLCLVALLVLGAGALWSPAEAQPAAPTGPTTTFTLEAALQYTLDHYPSVRAALEQVTASTAQVQVARAAYLPRLDSLWQTNRGTANNVFGQLLPQSVIPAMSGPVLASASATSVWGSATGALLSWEAYDFGLRAASVHEAEAGTVRAQSEQAVTRLAVEEAVGAAFLAVLSADQATTAADADVQRRDVLARAAHALVDNQLRPGADASRADAERAAAQTRAIQTREAATVARTVLARVLGITSPVSIDARQLLQTPPEVPVGTTPAAADHPLVRASQAAVDLSRAREAILEKTDRPKLLLQSALFARGTGANPDGRFETGFTGIGLDRANWAAGFQIVMPNLFDYASLRARRTAAGALTRAQQAQYDETVLTVSAEQRTADAALEAASAVAQNTPIQVAAARHSEAQARARYDAGLASIVEVAESQNLLAAAEYQDAAARVDIWRALLAKAVARGDLTPFIDRVRTAGAP